jgi:putative Mn2+ efflux pump MntP
MLTKKVIDSYSGFLLLFLLGIVGLYHNFRK